MQIDRIKLIAEMARKRMTVKEMARISGLCTATIINIRNGKSCSRPTCLTIAKALGVDVTQILAEEE